MLAQYNGLDTRTCEQALVQLLFKCFSTFPSISSRRSISIEHLSLEWLYCDRVEIKVIDHIGHLAFCLFFRIPVNIQYFRAGWYIRSHDFTMNTSTKYLDQEVTQQPTLLLQHTSNITILPHARLIFIRTHRTADGVWLLNCWYECT